MSQPIIQGKFVLQKMDAKGGWTYALLPGLNTKTGLPFGWFIVKGRIDDYEIKQYKLWPTKNKELFLPVKAEIRKKIKKQEGDMVDIVLYEDKSEPHIPEEFLMCLLDSPLAKHHFDNMSKTSQKQYVDYVYEAKSMDARARRIGKTIEKLEKGLKYHEKE
ncbi:MAG: DUF1905 domain-containing protein [Saprospiraceae bacterium]|nr:DUF1905 domain-containing protein [Saprospiraceae bacterium]MBK6566156.1 DUF1905 domain-containing protein [Saprospiraceae bacterium]MBK8369825.1 DUF1905 domain-containing protein [Saprospiraceae bacterium]MBK8548198.1 DUF1905 domain-containing protein [Saprospiraceae bacterium]MBK8819241.1 DUF1905 domain-containing protein [Saprospiraceae bacterium]